jgi:hypothetical protein
MDHEPNQFFVVPYSDLPFGFGVTLFEFAQEILDLSVMVAGPGVGFFLAIVCDPIGITFAVFPV